MGDLTKNFDSSEFACPCCMACEMDEDFMLKLQALRDKLNRPLKINSGYRCEAHNQTLAHAAKDSKHLEGIAADIAVVGGAERHELVRAAFEIGFTGIGIARSFIHLDTRPGIKTIFTYS